MLSIVESQRRFRKVFIDGVERKELLVPTRTLTLIGTSDGEGDELDDIHNVLQKVELERLDWFLLPEECYLRGSEESTDFTRKDSIDPAVERTWIQLDFDCKHEGSNWNRLDLEAKVKVAKELLPALNTPDLGMVVQGSNKAWLPQDFPDHLALRIYVRLSEPTKHKQLWNIFKPVTHIVDHKIFKKGNPLLVCPPVLLDAQEEELPFPDKRNILYIQGKASLNLEDISKTKDYAKNKDKSDRLQSVLVNVSGVEVSVKPDKRQKKEGKTKEDRFNDSWKDLEAYWKDKPTSGSRNAIFYELLARAQWVNLYGNSMVELICSSEVALGANWNRERVQKIKNSIDESNRSRLDHSLWNFDNHYTSLQDIEYVDFEKAREDGKLSELKEIVLKALEANKQIVLIVKGTHGSGKTSVVLMEVIAIVEEHLGHSCRALYCTSSRANARAFATKSGFKIYLTEDGKTKGSIGAVHDKYITGIQSLPALTENNRGYDIYAEDEVNQISNWSAWKNFPYADAHAVAAQAKVVLLMDADISELVYARGRMIQEMNRGGGLYKMQNTISYLPLQTLNIVKSQDQALLKVAESVDKEIPTHIHTDRADAIKTSWMSSLVLWANKRANKNGRGDIAVGFHANTVTHKTWKAPNGKEMAWEDAIHYHPTKFIEYLWELGYRILVTSPTIINGWRYHSESKVFKRSIGIYNASTQSYMDICQKLQRFVKCNEHWIYVRPKSWHSSKDAVTNLHLMEYFETTEAKYIAKIVSPSATNAILRSRAKAELEKIKENVVLDLFHYWETHGSIPVIWAEETIEQDPLFSQLENIREALKESRIETITTIVEWIMVDEHALLMVLDNFVVIEEKAQARTMLWTDLDENYDKQKEELVDLLDRLCRYGESEEWLEQGDERKVLLNKEMLKLDDVRRIHELMHGSEAEWAVLDGMNSDTDEAIRRRYSDRRFNRIIGSVFHAMSVEFNKYSGKDIVDWVLEPVEEGDEGNQYIVLRMEDLVAPRFNNLIKKWWDVLTKELPTVFPSVTTPDKQMARIAKSFFDIDRTFHHSGNKANIKNWKYDLINKYTKLAVCRKSDRVGVAIKKIEIVLLDRIANNIDLTDTETNYLINCNKYVILKKPNVIHKDMYLSLLGYSLTKNAIRQAS